MVMFSDKNEDDAYHHADGHSSWWESDVTEMGGGVVWDTDWSSWHCWSWDWDWDWRSAPWRAAPWRATPWRAASWRAAPWRVTPWRLPDDNASEAKAPGQKFCKRWNYEAAVMCSSIKHPYRRNVTSLHSFFTSLAVYTFTFSLYCASFLCHHCYHGSHGQHGQLGQYG